LFKMSHSTRRLPSGFSLVEIMVGMLIGMLGIIVMMQVYAVSEGQKRTTTGAGDAQNNGAIALYGMQRDIRQAGYGFSAFSLFSCTVTTPSGASIIPLAPVTINPATGVIPTGDANSDTLLVMYGNTNGEPQGQTYTANAATLSATNYYFVNTPCNPSPVSTGATSRAVSGTIYDLGTSPKVLAYAIRGGNLTVCDYIASDCSAAVADNNNPPAIWTPIASNIVSLRAQYGRDTLTVAVAAPPTPLPNYVVDTYDQSTPTTPCGWARAPAVRIALTARSGQYEKTANGVDVTPTPRTWEGGTIDLTANADWQHYRYKVFQTIVPLRNIAWMGVQAGC
jgi:type IV pilus assembly protein PilW